MENISHQIWLTVIVNHFPSAKLRRKTSHCKKNHENHTVLVSPFSENWKWQVIAMIFCLGSLTHFVTGIVSHFCNCYMLQLCWNHKFRGFQKVSDGFKRWRWFQKVSDGFKRWRWFQIVSEGFRWFQMVSRGKNKTLKTKTTFLKTIAITIALSLTAHWSYPREQRFWHST